MYYCDKECQREDWRNVHKHGECEIYKKCNQNDKAFQMVEHRLFLRVVILFKIDPNLKWKKFKFFNEERCFMDETRSKSVAPQIVNLSANVMSDIILNYFLSKAPFKMHFNEIKAINLRFLSKMLVHDLASDAFVSLNIIDLDSSCKPNASLSNTGKKFLLRSMDNIRHDAKVTISYTNLFMDKKGRKAFIYPLTCECDRCESNKNDVDYLFTLNSISDLSLMAKYAIEVFKNLGISFNPLLSKFRFIDVLYKISKFGSRICSSQIIEVIESYKVTHGEGCKEIKILQSKTLDKKCDAILDSFNSIDNQNLIYLSNTFQ